MTSHPRKLPRPTGPSRHIVPLLAALLAVLLASSSARAQTPPPRRGSLIVLGLRAPDGDDEAATNATQALRQSARAAGFDVPANSPALEQSMAAFGCDDSLPADCLAQIANDLHAERMLYGNVHRQGRGRSAQLQLEIALYDHATHSTPARDTTTLTRTVARDSEAILPQARRLIDSVLPAPAVVPVMAAPTPAPAPAPPPPASTASSGPSGQKIAGITSVVIGAGFAVAGAVLGGVWLGHNGSANDDPNWTGYQPTTDAAASTDGNRICDFARMNRPTTNGAAVDMSRVVGICNTGRDLMIGEIVSFAAAAAFLTVGTVLLVTDHGGSRPAAGTLRDARARAPRRTAFRFAPVISPGYQGGSFELRF